MRPRRSRKSLRTPAPRCRSSERRRWSGGQGRVARPESEGRGRGPWLNAWAIAASFSTPFADSGRATQLAPAAWFTTRVGIFGWHFSCLCVEIIELALRTMELRRGDGRDPGHGSLLRATARQFRCSHGGMHACHNSDCPLAPWQVGNTWAGPRVWLPSCAHALLNPGCDKASGTGTEPCTPSIERPLGSGPRWWRRARVRTAITCNPPRSQHA
jgi:hypothetical protein